MGKNNHSEKVVVGGIDGDRLSRLSMVFGGQFEVRKETHGIYTAHLRGMMVQSLNGMSAPEDIIIGHSEIPEENRWKASEELRRFFRKAAIMDFSRQVYDASKVRVTNLQTLVTQDFTNIAACPSRLQKFRSIFSPHY